MSSQPSSQFPPGTFLASMNETVWDENTLQMISCPKTLPQTRTVTKFCPTFLTQKTLDFSKLEVEVQFSDTIEHFFGPNFESERKL